MRPRMHKYTTETHKYAKRPCELFRLIVVMHGMVCRRIFRRTPLGGEIRQSKPSQESDPLRSRRGGESVWNYESESGVFSFSSQLRNNNARNRRKTRETCHKYPLTGHISVCFPSQTVISSADQNIPVLQRCLEIYRLTAASPFPQ